MKDKIALALVSLLIFISVFINTDFVFAQNFNFVLSQEIGNLPGAIFSLADDFNNNGSLDLAVANSRSATISILLGDGAGFFSLFNNFNVGAGSVDIVSGDFNEDGILDLASAIRTSGNVSVLLGIGDGSFSSGGAFSISLFQPNPVSIASGDFNNDGHLDLVVGNFRDNSVSILFGDGTGNFSQPSTNITVGSSIIIKIPGGEIIFIGITSVKIADFNEDGNLDIAAVHNKDGAIFILLGDGTGNFLISKTLPIGFDSRSLSVVDINKDGNVDLIVGSQSGIFIYLGDGSNNFLLKSIFSLRSLQTSMAVADFNTDGNLDLAVPNFFSGGVDIIAGDGTGGFVGPVVSFSTGSRPRGASSGDFNGDGLLDLVIANSGSGSDSISILLNTTPPITEVDIDLKPGSFPNCINLKSKGFTTMAILGEEDFNVTDVDTSTVEFAGVGVAVSKSGKQFFAFEDVNQDGLQDLVMHFKTDKLQLTGNENFALLRGNLMSGRPIKGTDTICFVPHTQ